MEKREIIEIIKTKLIKINPDTTTYDVKDVFVTEFLSYINFSKIILDDNKVMILNNDNMTMTDMLLFDIDTIKKLNEYIIVPFDIKGMADKIRIHIQRGDNVMIINAVNVYKLNGDVNIENNDLYVGAYNITYNKNIDISSIQIQYIKIISEEDLQFITLYDYINRLKMHVYTNAHKEVDNIDKNISAAFYAL